MAITVENAQSMSRQDWAECMERVKSEDKRAYAVIFRYFTPRLKQFLMKKINNEQVALELVQDTMAAVWQKSHMFDPEKSALSTWIYTLARNLCFDMLRKQKGKELSIESDDIWPGEYSPPDLVEHYSPEQMILKEQVMRYLHMLPDNQRDVVKAVYVDDISQQEAAERLDIPIGTVKSRLRLAVEKLKQTMNSEQL
ncbi:sigma-70 family RNA polymerase sigma factor [Vibrio sp. JC009]|uniref:sigma-70 family RNA polymerase sigma factor n=1 Tax=Vibrio sp. JC009 TaxID=2912314 RepID=UPI0023B1388F|nr:sigma-70 family RNA polymerase sigma factor [Vibrio sp. JC009]WED22444.1 sigma-70 family RNA polymerase sigma factor [Vibrio sp. JC009]